MSHNCSVYEHLASHQLARQAGENEHLSSAQDRLWEVDKVWDAAGPARQQARLPVAGTYWRHHHQLLQSDAVLARWAWGAGLSGDVGGALLTTGGRGIC